MTGYEVDFYRQFGSLVKTMKGIHEELEKANQLKMIELEHKGLIKTVNIDNGQTVNTKEEEV